MLLAYFGFACNRKVSKQRNKAQRREIVQGRFEPASIGLTSSQYSV